MAAPCIPTRPALTLDALSVEVDVAENLVTVAWQDRCLVALVVPSLGARDGEAEVWMQDRPEDTQLTADLQATRGVGAWEYLVGGWTLQDEWRRLQVRPLPRFTIQLGVRLLQVEQVEVSLAARHRSEHRVLEVVQDADGNQTYEHRYSILGDDAEHGGRYDVWDEQDPQRLRGDAAAAGLSFDDAIGFVAERYATGVADRYVTYCGTCGSSHADAPC